MALTFTLGGVDVLSYLDFRSLKVQEAEEMKGSTIDFQLRQFDEPVARPEAGQEIIFTDAGGREFAGTLIDVTRLLGESNRLVTYVCQGMDYTYLLDRRFVNKLYSSQGADLMMGEILDDLQSAANSDSADGDTHYDDFQGDKSLLDTDAPVVTAQRFERVLPSQAFEIIAEGTGMRWRVNFSKQVSLQPLGTIVNSNLPLNVEGKREIIIDTNTTNYFNFQVTFTILGVGTKSIIKGALIKSTATKTETHQWNNGDSLTVHLEKRPFSDLDITSVRANGVVMTQKLEDIDVAGDAAPDATECSIYVGPQRAGGLAYVRFNAADIADGQDFEIIYTYSISDDNESIDNEGVTEMARRTGGDGFHEFVSSRLNEISVVDLSALDQIQETILGRKSRVLVRGRFRSWTKGWAAGQIFNIRWDKENIVEEVYVVRVNKTILTPADDPNIGDNIIRSEIQFSNIPRGVRL